MNANNLIFCFSLMTMWGNKNMMSGNNIPSWLLWFVLILSPLIELCEYIDCLNFSYGVSSLIGDSESHPSLWRDVPVPPRFDNSEHVEIVNNNNNSVIFTINKGIKNQNCKVSPLKINCSLPINTSIQPSTMCLELGF